MSKEMEALKRMETSFTWNKEGKPSVYKNSTNSSIPYYQDFEIVENALKALEIIKEKVHFKFEDNYMRLRDYFTIIYPLTDEELEILKGVFKDE